MDTKEITIVKSAAQKMADFLATKNIKVKHTLMLEALSAGFDTADWRTLRAKLDGPSGHSSDVAPSESTGMTTWRFELEFDQPLFIEAASLLEAVIKFEAHATKWGNRDPAIFADVTAANSSSSRLVDAKSLLTIAQNTTYHDAMFFVHKYAMKGLGAAPSRGIAESEAYDEAYAPFVVFETMMDEFKRIDMVDHAGAFDDYMKEGDPNEEEVDFTFDFDNGMEITYAGYDGLEILNHVHNYAMKNVEDISTLAQREQIAFYKYRAIMQVLAHVINHAFWNKSLDGSFIGLGDD